MALEADGASGPPEGNAAKAGNSLDDAISAAIGASEGGSKSDGMESRSKEVEAEAPETEIAGDKPGGEKAPKPKDTNKLESTKDTGAPEAPKVFEAPKHWSEADRSAFAGLPDDAKGIVAKLAKNLEGGFTRKSQELSDKAKYADGVRGLFNDTDRHQMAQSGTDEVGVIHYLLGLQRFATQKPVEYVKWAMQNLGVSPDKLGLPQANQPDPKKPDEDIEALLRDPKVSALEAELADLKKWRQERETNETTYRQHQYATQVQSIQSAISEFRSALDDESGQLKYPHFDTVFRHMGALMDTDPDLARLPDGPEKLQAAYDMAVWARPDLRQSFIEQEAQKRTMDEQKRANAERAKRATAVKPAVNIGGTKPRVTSLDAAVEIGMSKAGF